MSRIDDIIENNYFSDYFFAKYDRKSYEEDMALSERQLFTQSNGRVLLGQDNMGRLHFITVPHSVDYPLPVCRREISQHITACPGMFYQTDLTTFLGKAFYRLECENGMIYVNGTEESTTRYLGDYLPWTNTVYSDIQMDTFSIAPVMPKPMQTGLKTLPLPGPSGAVYAMRLKNTGTQTIQGKVQLLFDEEFVSKYEHCGKPVETRAFPAQYKQLDRNLLLLQRPEGYAGIWMKEGCWEQHGGNYSVSKEVCIAPGEECVLETFICVSETPDGISEALSYLYMNDFINWEKITFEFWKNHLGELSVSIKGEEKTAQLIRDMHVRNIIDNFNCIQTDKAGRVLVHWQGAPSHNMGRMWGIDVEPTTLSFVNIFPELAEKLIEYMLDRNEPAYSVYEEHSTPIMMAPLIMAGEYLSYTGNVDYFKKNPEILQRLTEIWNKIVSFRYKNNKLIPSRYSSDGIVMRRYDHGTNVKFWYATMSYGHILKSLGQDNSIQIKYADQLKADIETAMVIDGPFGRQISGGTNLGEQDNFYMDEDFLYYDGEDSSSALAPVYGIYNYSYEPWINYHRFARSLFCSNYDPEMHSLRWFPYGGAIDGTAYVSILGGAVTKNEMKTALNNMIHYAVDNTGSLYWWPKGKNKRRMIARCSQGQGSWIMQFIKQWLGINTDATENTVRIAPLGLLDSYTWKHAELGFTTLDISYCEKNRDGILNVTNHGNSEVKIIFESRDPGLGAVANLVSQSKPVIPGETVKFKIHHETIGSEEEFDIEAAEVSLLADENGVLLQHFGLQLPSTDDDQKQNMFLLRYILGNNTLQTLENIRVTFSVPDFWRVCEKKSAIWDAKDRLLDNNRCTLEIPHLSAGKTVVLPVWIDPGQGSDASLAWFDGHPFLSESKRGTDTIYMASELKKDEQNICIQAEYQQNGNNLSKNVCCHVKHISHTDFPEFTRSILGNVGE